MLSICKGLRVLSALAVVAHTALACQAPSVRANTGTEVGDRVVRGPDWSWGNQDGGPGNEGTVLNVNLSTALWVRVKWASGDENNYRIGADGKYDLCQVKNKECGRSFNEFGDGGVTISSPNFPHLYPNMMECTWNIDLEKPCSIIVNVTDLSLEDKCQDNVVIRHLRSSQIIQETKLCDGTALTPFHYFVKREEKLQVIFSSDPRIAKTGFRMTLHEAQFEDYNRIDRAISDVDRSCLNGGTKYGSTLTSLMCICPPGFKGVRCEKACDPGRYGNSCERECSGDSIGCLGHEICTVARDDVNGSTPLSCSCASGLKGPYCTEVCDLGDYGANCTQRCGHCRDGGYCDPFTGHCDQGCDPGYTPPYCLELTAPDGNKISLTHVSESAFSGFINVTPVRTVGEGRVKMYELQYKEPSSPDWSTGALGSPCEASVPNCSLPFRVDGLKPNTTLHVRVLLLEGGRRTFDRVPYTVVRTLGERQVANLEVVDVSARSMRVNWTSPAKEGPFTVIYECDSLLACPAESCEAANGMLMVASDSVLLEGLLPFAKYRVIVARDDEAEAVTATTRMAVPSVSVSGLEVSLLTNTTAVLRWRPPFPCMKQNGPATKFAWELHRGESDIESSSSQLYDASSQPLRSGITSAMVIMLRDLTPLTDYVLRVNIVNAEGSSPDHWAILPFTTKYSVPDEPRSLTAYRRNATAVYLRWEPPSRPRGALSRYVVEVKGPGVNRNETVPPTAACAAKPGFTCHVVAGLQPGRDYSVNVSAVNEHGDEPGPPAALRVPAYLGVPTAPQSLSIKELKARSVVLQWQLPGLINSDLHYFEVLVLGLLEAPRRVEVKADVEKPWYECGVDGLALGAAYSVSVRCGPFGEVARLTFTTPESEDPQ